MRNVAALTVLAAAGFIGASAASAMTVTSAEIKSGGNYPTSRYSAALAARVSNVSPSLAWTGAPKATKSFAISMYDPDAPTGSGFWHWWVVNIPADTTSLPKGAGGGTGLPAGATQGRNDFSINTYGGPCPPPGNPHHYHITVYALDTDKIDIDANTSPAVIGFMTHAHTLAKAELIGLLRPLRAVHSPPVSEGRAGPDCKASTRHGPATSGVEPGHDDRDARSGNGLTIFGAYRVSRWRLSICGNSKASSSPGFNTSWPGLTRPSSLTINLLKASSLQWVESSPLPVFNSFLWALCGWPGQARP